MPPTTIFCPRCRMSNDGLSRFCVRCGQSLDPSMPPPPSPRPLADEPGIALLIPIGVSPWAIVAGYLGLLSLLLVPGPFAIVLSMIAMRDLRANPDRRGKGRAIFGLVMGLLGTIGLVAVLIGRLAA